MPCVARLLSSAHLVPCPVRAFLYHLRAVVAVLKRTDVLVQVKREGVQDMRVTGSIPELGSWKPDKAPRLTNVKGNTWEAVVAVPSDELRTFEYKLVEVRNGKVTIEKGNNRLSDAHLVEPQRDVDASGKLSKQRVSDLECSWEGLLVRFIIYHPLDDPDALLACSGSHEALGGSPPPRTNWTRRVLHPVLIGHVRTLRWLARRPATHGSWE